MTHCIHCYAELCGDRAEFLRETGRPAVCVTCSRESSRLVLMEYAHKTAGYPVIVPRGDEEKAMRAYRRAR